MKRRLLAAAVLMSAWGAYSQVGIGTLTPDASSQLDVTASDKGMLIPRVGLTSTTDATTITNGNVNSLLVFNTNTQNDITPGYYYWYEDKWMRIVNEDDVAGLDTNTTNVSLTVVGGELVLTDSEGNEVTIPLSEINIPTTLVQNPDGTYTYTNEEGTTVTIDATENIINNIDNILNNTEVLNELIEVLGDTYVGGNVYYDGDQFTYIDESGETHTINFEEIVQANETVTTLVNNNDGTYTYTSEDGTETIVDVPASVINQFEEIVNGGPVTIEGEEYTTIEEYIQHIVETNETVTTLVNNNDGTYTYTSEDGTVTVVDVPASVINQFEEIVNGGPVTIDGDTYNTIEEYIQHLVETNETVTTLVNNNDGTYTYTSEDGTVTVVDVPASVINQFEEIVNGGPVTIDGDTYNTIEEYIQHLVETNETVTTLVNNNDGTYTYTSEDGTETIVDVPASVINQFEEIVNGGPVTIDGDTYNTIEEYIQHLVETNETVTTLVNNNDGTYTYTSEDGTETTINVAQDVIENFETIVNESNTEVIEQLITVLGDTYVGGNVYYDGDTFTYVDEAGDSHVINFEEIVQANETVTTLETLGEGQYLYTSEDGTETTINVAQDVIENFETIVNESNTEVIEQLITVLGDTYVGGNVYYDGDTFTYVDEAGDSHVINFEEIVQANETVTTLETLGEGQYLYTSEDGTETTINVAQDVIENFETIVNESNTEVIEQLITVLGDTYVGGNVYYDGDTFTYVDEAGDSHVINFEEIVQANETVTTLVNNNDGTYTYTSEDGTVTVVDVPASVINQFEEIVKGGPVTIDGDEYTTIEEYIQHLVETNETVTTLVDNNDGTYTYTSEDGTVTTVDVPASVINQFEEIVNSGPVTIDGNEYTTIEEYIQHIVETNETVTTLVNNNDGTYTYTSEDGTITTVDVPADIVNQFEEIVNSGPVTIDGDEYTTIEEYIQHLVETNETVTTLVNNNDGTYTYTSEDGTVTTVDVPASVINQFEEIVNGGPVTIDGDEYTTIEEYIQHLVETNETVTTLVNNNDGTYTYTSEDGTVTTVDVPADIVNQFEEIVNGGPVTIDGDTYNTIEEYIQHLVETNETVTTLVNNNDGTYTYTSEDGTVTVVDVPASVINQFEEIVNGGPVTIDGDTYNTIEEYIQHLVETNETVTTLVNNNDGTYTYTSEDGTVTVVDVPASVINQFEEIVNGGPVTIDGDTYNTIEEYIQHLVETNETVTTLVNNNDGTYTYTSEDGTETTINVAQDVIENFETIVNESNTEVIEQLITVLGDTYVGGNVYYDGDTFTYVDEAGDSHVINFEEIVQANETVTTLETLGEGQYLYTSEDGTETTINVAQDVIENFETIVNESNTEVIEQLVTVLGDTYVGGNVYYDGDTFTYVDEAGDSHVINFEEIVQANETVTTLVNNNDGTYTYTSEDGTVTVVDVPASVINQFEEIVKGGPVTIEGEEYTTIEEYIQHIVETNESVTTLVDNGDGTYTYTSEDGTVTVVDVPASVINQFEEIVNGGPVTIDGDTYNTIEEYIQHLVETNETVTTLVNNNDGTYTYTSEDGTVTVVDVPADVINQFEEIVNGGPVTIDGDTYNTIEEYIQHLVETNETVTTLVNNNDGTYTYTSEDGTVTVVDVPASVINQFEEIVNGGPVTIDGDTYNTIEEYIQHLVETNETVTTLVNNNDGTYTYTSEDGTVTVVDVPADVINQFEEIVNGGPVTIDGDTYNTIEEYIQHLVETNETVTTLVNNNDGTYTYTSEDDTETIIKPIDYSYTVQETGREWVNENPVMEIVADITLTTANNTFVLPNDVPVGSTVISVRFISKANGSISTNVLEYNNTTRELVLGTTGSLTVLHPAGDYYLIVEYAEN